MFHDSSKVNDSLTLQKCTVRLDEPRILPCGNSICSHCVSSIQLKENKEFQCLVCCESHKMHKNGLPLNKIVLEMLSLEAIQVSRGKVFNALQKILKDIQKEQNLFEHYLTNPTDYIKEHFINLRNEVQLTAEELHEQIDDLSEEVILEINEYEKKLINSNNINLDSFQSFKLIEKQLESFHLQTEEYLKQPKLNDEKLDQLNQHAIALKENSNSEIENLKEIILNGQYIKFEPNKVKLNKSFLGRMHNNILNSSILSDLKEINELMTLCEFPVDQKWRLIYKGSEDGFKASDFHSKCDNKPNTLVVIKSSNGNVFGGYTDILNNHGQILIHNLVILISLTQTHLYLV
jgi:hypothetical protein